MNINEKQAWEFDKFRLERIKETCHYKVDVELQRLVQQAEEILAEIVPDMNDYSGEGHIGQWEQLRLINKNIDNRIAQETISHGIFERLRKFVREIFKVLVKLEPEIFEL